MSTFAILALVVSVSMAQNSYEIIPAGKYCGAALGVSASIVVSDNSFTWNIYAASPCAVQGSYALSGSVVSFTPTSSTCGSSLSVTLATYSSNTITLYGSSNGEKFTAAATMSDCAFVVLPSGSYCGRALGTSAIIVVSGNTFTWNIFADTPCTVYGTYGLAGSVVSFNPLSSSCSSLLTVSSVTYASSAITISGSFPVLGAFTATAAMSECASMAVPSGDYCGSALSTPGSFLINGNQFSLSIFGLAPCAVAGSYTLTDSTVSFIATSSTCGSSLVVSSVTYSSGTITIIGDDFGENFTATAERGSCSSTVIPAGSYCGSALGYAASIAVTGNSFVWSIFGTNPCAVSGTYSRSGSAVSYIPTQSTCASSLQVSTVTFSSGNISISGSFGGMAFNAIAAASQCAEATIPTGTYAGSVLGTSSAFVVSGSTFSWNIFGSAPCSIAGIYTLHEATTSFVVTSSTCSSTLMLSSVGC